MTPAHILQLAFTSDKTYPSYWDLSESTGYISGYEEVQGNPMLKPSTDYSANLNYILQAEYRQAKCDKFFDLSFNHSKWIGLGMLQNNLTLSTQPDIRIELTGLYLSPSIQGNYDLSNVWAIHAGLRWNFANQKASLQLKATDLFNSMQGDIDVTLRNKGQYMDMHINSYSRNVTLSFTYKFGGYKEKQHKPIDTSRFK